MNRLLLRNVLRDLFLPCLLSLCLTMPAQASLLGELGQSLLQGPSELRLQKSDADLSPSGQVLDSLHERSPFSDSAVLGNTLPGEPAVLLMPLGRDGDMGVGLGLRFSF